MKKVPNSQGFSEKRISKSIQRDSWSALKYALRFAQILERTVLMVIHKKNDWTDLLQHYAEQPAQSGVEHGSRIKNLRRGRLY